MLTYCSPCGFLSCFVLFFLCQASVVHSQWKLWFRVNRACVQDRTPLLRVSDQHQLHFTGEASCCRGIIIVFSVSKCAPCISNQTRKNSRRMSVAEWQHEARKSKDLRYAHVTANAQILRRQNRAHQYFQISVTYKQSTYCWLCFFFKINFVTT